MCHKTVHQLLQLIFLLRLLPCLPPLRLLRLLLSVYILQTPLRLLLPLSTLFVSDISLDLQLPFRRCHLSTFHGAFSQPLLPLPASKLNLRCETGDLLLRLRQRIDQDDKFPLRHASRDIDALFDLDLLVLVDRALLLDVVVALQQVAQVLVALQYGDLPSVVELELHADQGVGAFGDGGGDVACCRDREGRAAVGGELLVRVEL